ncbi:YveK family protein [Microbacterium memoriense]|uniref:Capsular polysaccharide biosynthesis protein n=1 Tax=Microbacterium memoriense TaxID=2978350 RepID=A0ABT2PEJ4_9MICO|nr:hypothetical protein [Microbacterium memoriense]MCT9002632.1 hypothetical protein [Microbacterium memoriense]
MTLLDLMRAFTRRWYIVIPGMVLAFVAAFGAWTVVAPTYERAASQLLLPGLGTLPEGATNPYLYLGGLTPPADVLVRAVSSEDVLRPVLEQNPGIKIEIARDPTASGPVIQTKVTAADDEVAGAVLEGLMASTTAALDDLQAEEGIPVRDRITITTVSVDAEGKVQQRDRVVASAGAGIILLVLSLVIASLVDGLVTRRGRTRRPMGDGASGDGSDTTRSRTAREGDAPEDDPESGPEGDRGTGEEPEGAPRPRRADLDAVYAARPAAAAASGMA